MNPKLILGLIPTSVVTISTIIGDYITLNNGQKYMTTNMAIGALLAVLSLELVPMMHKSPKILHKGLTVLGILMALLFLFLLKKYTHKIEQISKKEDNKSNTLKDDLFHNIPLCIGLFLDGLIIGLQKNSSHVEGLALILSCALSLDNLFVGLSIGNEIGDNIPLLIITSILLGLSVIVGTISGIYSYDSLKNSPFLYTIISFGVTALLWETFQELMPDSRRLKNDSQDNTHYNLYGMYIGFLAVFMVSWLGK
jgi:zinc transporter ZupT